MSYSNDLLSKMNELRKDDILTNFTIISDTIEYRVIYHSI